MKIGLISFNSRIESHGIRSISSYLKQHGHKTRLIFLPKNNGLGQDISNFFIEPFDRDVIEQVLGLTRDLDIVGVSFMSQFYILAKQITNAIKARTKIPVIWGGVHPTVDPEECLDFCDAVCVGEGEEATLKLLDRMAASKNIYNARNFWFKRNDELIKNPLNPLEQDLDRFPFEDYEYENEHYLLFDGKIQKINFELMGKFFRVYVTNVTRGCPYRCSYCVNHLYNNLYKGQLRIRKRKIDSVISELKYVLYEKNFKMFTDRIRLWDDYFLSLTVDEIEHFSRRYKEEINLPLSIGGFHPKKITLEKIKPLVDAGMDTARMGIQSGSDMTRKLFCRIETNHNVIKAARIFNTFKKGLHAGYDFILDNPYENDDDLLESLKLLIELPRPYSLVLFSLVPFPGTEFYYQGVREGRLSEDWEENLKQYFSKEYKPYREDSYFNNLFNLFDLFPLPKFVMRFFVNKRLIRYKVTLLPYLVLRKASFIPKQMRKLRTLQKTYKLTIVRTVLHILGKKVYKMFRKNRLERVSL